MQMYDLPDNSGHFGPYGGIFVAETLMQALEQLRLEQLHFGNPQHSQPPFAHAVGAVDDEHERMPLDHRRAEQRHLSRRAARPGRPVANHVGRENGFLSQPREYLGPLVRDPQARLGD